jgi:Zn-dependent oligopeptidase
LFSEVICHDVFAEFSKSGNLMGPEVIMRYRKEILDKGGAEDGEDMVKAFLGRQYNSDAFKDWMRANIDRYE